MTIELLQQEGKTTPQGETAARDIGEVILNAWNTGKANMDKQISSTLGGGVSGAILRILSEEKVVKLAVLGGYSLFQRPVQCRQYIKRVAIILGAEKGKSITVGTLLDILKASSADQRRWDNMIVVQQGRFTSGANDHAGIPPGSHQYAGTGWSKGIGSYGAPAGRRRKVVVSP